MRLALNWIGKRGSDLFIILIIGEILIIPYLHVYFFCISLYIPLYIIFLPLPSAKPIRTGPASLLSRPGALGMMGRPPTNTPLPRQFVGKHATLIVIT